MKGSVYRAGAGWAYRVDVGPDPVAGKRRQRYRSGFRTKKLAEAALIDLRTQVARGTYRRTDPGAAMAVTWDSGGPGQSGAKT